MPFLGPHDATIDLHRLETPEEASRWRPGFVGAYQTVFADEPYFERFTSEEADGIYHRLVSIPENITLLAVEGTRVAGFSAAIPLRFKRDVARSLSGLVSVQHGFYLAELGVLREHRSKGLGRKLIQERLRLIDRDRYSHVVLRVAASRNASYDMYRSMGFEDMGVYMEVPMLRTDGSVTTDRRLFLCSVISEVQGASQL